MWNYAVPSLASLTRGTDSVLNQLTSNLCFFSLISILGKYICDGDASTDNRYRYAAPQTINTDYLDGPSEC